MAPGETVIWSGRAGVFRSLGFGQIIFAVAGLGLLSYGARVFWGHYGWQSALADSVFRDVLLSPTDILVSAGLPIVFGLLALAGFLATVLRARGTRFYLSQSQVFVHTRTPFGEAAVAGRIQENGQFATARNMFGAAIAIPTGLGDNQDGFIAFDGLRDEDVTTVLARLAEIGMTKDSGLDAS